MLAASTQQAYMTQKPVSHISDTTAMHACPRAQAHTTGTPGSSLVVRHMMLVVRYS